MAKKTVKKQSSPRLSTLAGQVLRKIQLARQRGEVNISISVDNLEALAGSVLSQDERKGQGE